MRRVFLAAAIVVFLVGVVRPSAQPAAPPTSAPMLQAGDITYLGSVRVPETDGTCVNLSGSNPGCLGYGGWGLGWGPVVNGQRTVFISGHDVGDQMCQVTAPAVGGTATVVGKCVTVPNRNKVDSAGTGVNGIVPGGALYYNGRLLVTYYAYYPGSNSATATHVVSTNGQLTGLTGNPVRVGTLPPAAVAGYMGTVPPEWQAALGGPAFTGNCCTSIISRSSYGPSVGTFNPDQVGAVNPAPFTPLVFYDQAHPLAPYEGAEPSNLFNGSTVMGGVMMPSGFRSVVFIGRQGLGDRCYGTGTDNQALHQTPHPEGNRWCYDPAQHSKGDHAYPYVHQLWVYDANDLAKVKAGQLPTWAVKPTILPLTGLPSGNGNGATINSASYDDASRLLLVTEHYSDASYHNPPAIQVFQVRAASGTPINVDCKLSEFSAWMAIEPWSACVNGSQTQQQKRTRTILTQPSGQGKRCDELGPLEEPRIPIPTQACSTPTPAEAFVTSVSFVVAGDAARTLTVDVPVTIGTSKTTVPLVVNVPAGLPRTVTVNAVCSRPESGTWSCVAQ